ncbi:MAG: sensor histidine kinase [Candidatus Binataceae bacterium]
MRATDFSELDLNIARARVVLSLVAFFSVYVDPATGGIFYMSTYALITLTSHLIYSTGTYFAVSRRLAPHSLPSASMVLDVLFAAAVALVTEGPTSASYMFFVFAIIAVDCRTGFRSTLSVTFCSGLLYFFLLAFSAHGEKHLYLMRAVYLTITGYLIGFIGQQRANFELRIRELETNAERHRIARSLHDDYVQALAGVALRLETCRELLTRERPAEALAQLKELQMGVSREFDQVRAYVRSLANLDQTLRHATSINFDTRFKIQAAFAASGLIVEQIIQIMLEGMRNALHHGNARSAMIKASEADGVIRITIDDDGVGFEESEKPPWAIASRVAEFGGRLRMTEGKHPGAHLEIEMPAV